MNCLLVIDIVLGFFCIGLAIVNEKLTMDRVWTIYFLVSAGVLFTLAVMSVTCCGKIL